MATVPPVPPPPSLYLAAALPLPRLGSCVAPEGGITCHLLRARLAALGWLDLLIPGGGRWGGRGGGGGGVPSHRLRARVGRGQEVAHSTPRAWLSSMRGVKKDLKDRRLCCPLTERQTFRSLRTPRLAIQAWRRCRTQRPPSSSRRCGRPHSPQRWTCRWVTCLGRPLRTGGEPADTVHPRPWFAVYCP